MLVSTNLRNWGIGSAPAAMLECAIHAEAAGIGTVWVNERLSTPAGMGWAPDDGGRYLDCLMALTYIAARTEKIQLGTGVLNVPYHLPFQLVKQVATLQDLSAGRFRFGVGVGWSEVEFQVIGIPYHERGKQTDASLRLLHDAFAQDMIEVNGVAFPVLPRPVRPPVYIGGHSDAALKRAVAFGDGWIAAGKTPSEIAAPRARLTALAEVAGKQPPAIIAMKTLPLDDPEAAIEMAQAYSEAGCAEVVHAGGYPDVTAYRKRVDVLARDVIPAVA